MRTKRTVFSGLAAIASLVLSAGACSPDSAQSKRDPSPTGLATSTPTSASESSTPKTTTSSTPSSGETAGLNLWEAHLTQAATAVGVTSLESPELQPLSARMVGVWRDRAVVLAYYNDVKHSGGGQVIAQITVGTVPASLIDPPATPTYIRMDCGDDHYEVSVTKTSRLTTKSEYDTELTRSLAGKIATEVGCSAQ